MSIDSRPDSRPVHLREQEAEELERRLRGETRRSYQHIGDQNGKAEVYKIALTIAGFLAVVVLGIFGWVAVHIIEQQDDQSRRLATVEAKIDIILSNRNGK